MKHKFLFSVFIIFFILVFIALGAWQIIRLNWKNNLILEIENSLKNPPVELTQSNKQNYLKIKIPETILISLHQINLINNFNRVIGLKDGEIVIDSEIHNINQSELDWLF